MHAEGLRKAFYGNAIVRLRQGNDAQSKYYTAIGGRGEPEMPSIDALSLYGNFLTTTAKAKNITIDEAAKFAENKWDELKTKDPKKYERYSTAKGGGYSPFLLWLKNEGMKDSK